MARVAYTESDVNLIARMIREEAESEGRLGMLMVGNVIINRVKTDCLDFEGLTSINDVIYQVQGGNYSFEAVQKGDLFYNRARGVEKN